MTSSARNLPLRVLHLEDSEMDHELITAQMRRGGMHVLVSRVETEHEFKEALEIEWDIVLSDFNLPGFSGLAALEIVRQSGKLLPFILVSGEIGEDTAVAAMRSGASDYLLKQNLARLVPAMLNAIDACQLLRAKEKSDAALAKSEIDLRNLAGYLQTRVEAERADIAREIHDDVGGSLTAVKFDISWIARHAPNDVIRARAEQALETIDHALESSQRIMHNLRPAILEQGLVAALQWMTSRFEVRTGIRTIFTTSHEKFNLPSNVPLVAYRAAQEALTNISKHAHATQVKVDLMQAAGVLSLEVSDNGRGLTEEDLAKSRSFGIRGLNERAATVGGWIDLSSGVNGTSLILSIPLQGNRDKLATHISKPHEDPNDPTAWGKL